jgi:hypothetical protein
MTQVSELPAVAEPLALIPRDLAATMRPQLASLATEIITEIRRSIPEYARPMDGPYGRMLSLGVHEMITTFVDQVADPTLSREPLRKLCRDLGRIEAQEGRNLESLHAAYRIGARLAWQRITDGVQRYELTPVVTSLLAQGLFSYMDELAAQSWSGFLDEQAKSSEVVAQWRLQLLRLILDDQPAPRIALMDLSTRAKWPLPEVVTMVAVRTGAQKAVPLPDDMLPDLGRSDPYVLLAGEAGADRIAGLRTVFPDATFVVGLPVPLARARDSLRWARRVLGLADAGLIEAEGPITYCADHLLTLLVMSDEALVEQITKRHLSALDDLTDRQSRVLQETLAAWLAVRGDAQRTASMLGVHPQTVRYRRRQLDRLVGDRMDDPETRLLTEVALHARGLREHGGGEAAG